MNVRYGFWHLQEIWDNFHGLLFKLDLKNQNRCQIFDLYFTVLHSMEKHLLRWSVYRRTFEDVWGWATECGCLSWTLITKLNQPPQDYIFRNVKDLSETSTIHDPTNSCTISYRLYICQNSVIASLIPTPDSFYHRSAKRSIRKCGFYFGMYWSCWIAVFVIYAVREAHLAIVKFEPLLESRSI